MKIQMYNDLNMKPEYAEKTRRLSGSLVMSIAACCLCCFDGTGGVLFCK